MAAGLIEIRYPLKGMYNPPLLLSLVAGITQNWLLSLRFIGKE